MSLHAWLRAYVCSKVCMPITTLGTKSYRMRHTTTVSTAAAIVTAATATNVRCWLLDGECYETETTSTEVCRFGSKFYSSSASWAGWFAGGLTWINFALPALGF